MSQACLTVDLGSSSGRVMAASLQDGHVTLHEVHRFAHSMQEQDGYWCWDLAFIWKETCEGILKGLEHLDLPASEVTVSVDTWGVDYAYLDSNGKALGPGRTYRDPRTTRTQQAFDTVLPPQRVWELTAIQPATINTANQLFAQLQEEPDVASQIATVLPLPDWFVYQLTGKISYARSIASTTGLTTPGATQWSPEVFTALNIPAGWFSKQPVKEGTLVGTVIDGLGFDGLQVVHGGAHDTACAVNAIPLQPHSNAAFISCGSWAVLGMVAPDPLTSQDTFDRGLTNEVCTDGQIRTLCNLTGLWILQQCQAQWKTEGKETNIVTLVEQAKHTSSSHMVIDVQDPRYGEPTKMVDELYADLSERYPDFNAETCSQGQVVRIVLESLAAAIGIVIGDLEELSDTVFDTIHLMGGGSLNTLLCQMCADATQKMVIAGPAEASALGAALAQFMATNAMSKEDVTDVVSASTPLVRYDPSPGLLHNQMATLRELRAI